MPWAAAAIAGSAVLGAGASMMSANTAAGASRDAADKQAQMYQQTRTDLSPYNTMGQNALQDAYALAKTGPYGGGPNYLDMAYQHLPGQMTQAELEQTPGYQWNL